MLWQKYVTMFTVYRPLFFNSSTFYFFLGCVESSTAYDTHESHEETERMVQFINTILSRLK